jgi:Short C-terminal domain
MMRRRRGLGLLGTMAVGGAAYAAGNSAAKSNAAEQAQNQQLAELQAQAATQQPSPSATPVPSQMGTSMDDRIEQLQKLADLRNSGLLTEAEFNTQKARLLES